MAGGYGYSYGPRWNYAGWWRRFVAAIVDGLIVGVPSGIVQTGLRASLPTKLETCHVNGQLALCESPTGGSWVVIVLVSLGVLAIVAYFYYGRMEGLSGQTLGKRALGIRVIDAQTAQPIGVGRGVGRYFARILSTLPCFLGYLWAAWDGRKQTWHDKMVSSVVVRV